MSELIKNSSDADAKIVTFMFENFNSIGGALFIEADGIGMTRDQLINGFIRISSTDKLYRGMGKTVICYYNKLS